MKKVKSTEKTANRKANNKPVKKLKRSEMKNKKGGAMYQPGTDEYGPVQL